MAFEVFYYQDSWQPFCSVEYNHLCNFGRGYYEEQFCEIILNLVIGSGADVVYKISYLELW